MTHYNTIELLLIEVKPLNDYKCHQHYENSFILPKFAILFLKILIF